jgi:four helix bundle protein
MVNSKDSAISCLVSTLKVKTLDIGKLKIIKQADQISDIIWEEVAHWRNFEKDTIGKQLVRAADSISANLSEAIGRYSYPDRKRFAYFARGSLCETINWLEKSSRRGLLDDNLGSKLLSELQTLSLRLNAFINTLKKPTNH